MTLPPAISETFRPPPDTGKIYVFPTRYGLLFIALLAAMLLGSLNYKNNMGMLMTFLLAGIGLASAVATHRNLAGMRLSSLSSRPTFAGDPLPVSLQVRSPNRESVEIACRIDDNADRRNIPPGPGASMALHMATTDRGRISFEQVTTESTFPLGLFRAWRHVPFNAAAGVVYPRPLAGPMPAGEQRGKRRTGAGASGQSGVDDFNGLKAYQPGDSLQRVDWKAFSRKRGLHTKTFMADAGRTVILDWQRLPALDWESRISTMCYAILTASDSGMVFGLRLPGVWVPPNTGAGHRHACLTHLSLMERQTP
jgi:uncharacterized protein (DUF58 family)